jgi:ATP-binding cassette subfamily E protein 1
MIRSILTSDNYVLVVEHDLSILDYMSDYICCLYGVPGAYGVVTLPSGVREGINIFLSGFIPSENLRFRDEELTFRVSDGVDNEVTEGQKSHMAYSYPSMVKSLGTRFKVTVEEGRFNHSEIIVMLGQNGTGKTTFINLLAGLLKPDDDQIDMPELKISYKP